jgi:hypothetical protein
LLTTFRSLLQKHCQLAHELEYVANLPATEAEMVEDLRYAVDSQGISAVYRADADHMNGEPPELEWRKWPTSNTNQLCDDSEVAALSFPVMFLAGGGFNKSQGLTRQQHLRFLLFQADPRFTRCHRAYEEYVLQAFNTIERYSFCSLYHNTNACFL